MSTGAAPCNIFRFQDIKYSPDPIFQVKAECLQPVPVPIVVDNGSFQARAGWACNGADIEPPPLEFRPLVARCRGAARCDSQVGNDIPQLEPLRWLLKSQFDRNAVVNFEVQELMLDYIFIHLGIATEGHVEHPIVLTEATCNPLHCRLMMSELLFECYGVPKVAYGIDGLFSSYYNSTKNDLEVPYSGLVVSSGYNCSHVLPFINGRLDAGNCQRLNVGGSHITSYMQKLLQLKYPVHQAAITPSRIEEMLHHHCYVALDYHEEIEKWRSVEFYEAEVHRMQLPFSEKAGGVYVNVEEKQDKRAQQLCRLWDSGSRQNEEKLREDRERLNTLLTVQELLEEGAVEQFHRRLMELNMDSTEELLSYIQKLKLSLEMHMSARDEFTELLQPRDKNDSLADSYEESVQYEKSKNSQVVVNMAEYHQLFVGTERVRATEVLFRPYLIGEEQMGLTEMLQFVLEQYSPEQQAVLAENVYLTGGNMHYPGVKERIEREMLAMRPFQSHFKVSLASHPSLDAWFGAREWALKNISGSNGWISRHDYEEKGGGYLSEHSASNIFTPLRISKPMRVNEMTSHEATLDINASAFKMTSHIVCEPDCGI